MPIKLLCATIALATLWHTPAKGQVQDNFTDGEFATNPTWVGETTRFQVSPTQELQSAGTGTDLIHLATANTYLSPTATTEWRIRIRLATLAMAPSASNYIKVYLTASQADLEGDLNGYYIRIGENGSNDAIDLFRQDGPTNTLILPGMDATVEDSLNLHLRITRTPAGQWEVFRDLLGGTTFVSEGTATDPTHATTAFMGVVVGHTSTTGSNYFFDDVYAGPLLVDTTPPQPLAATPLNPNALDVLFSEPLAQAPAQTPANYTLNNGIGTPQSATLDAQNPALVHLSLAAPMANNTYALTIAQVADLAGNAIPAATPAILPFTYFAPDAPAPGDVVFNELMADPTPEVGLPNAEWVELFNASTTKTFDLAGWTLDNGSGPKALPSITMPPGTYALLVPAANAADFQAFGPLAALATWPALTNTGDNLGLRSSTGILIDSLDYDDAWYGGAPKADGGWTLEKTDPTPPGNCPAAKHWAASIHPNGGTPGALNSRFGLSPDTSPPALLSASATSPTTVQVCFDEFLDPAAMAQPARYSLGALGTPASATVLASGDCVTLALAQPLQPGITYTLSVTNAQDCSGNAVATLQTPLLLSPPPAAGDVVIHEIMADPTPQVGLPNTEWIELFNASAQAFDMAGWTLDTGGDPAPLPAHVLAPGAYLVLAPAATAAQMQPFGPTLAPATWPGLTNTADQLALRSPQGLLIDSVAYADDWYNDPKKAEGGWSLEKTQPSPQTACPPATYWAASEDIDGGTPGRQNSTLAPLSDTQPPALELALAVSTDTVQVCFSEYMDLGPLADPANYQLPGLGTPLAATPQSSGRCVILRLGTPLVVGEAYTLLIQHQADCSGNAAGPLQAPLLIGQPAAPGDIVITELFPDPTPAQGLPESEFVELHNRTPRALRAQGWTLADATGSVILPDLLLLPHAYVILCATTAAADFQALGPVAPLASLPSLNNDRDSITLRDPAGNLSDQAYYDLTWYQDEAKADGGWTLERIDPQAFQCPNPDNWAASAHPAGGTPGQPNSIAGTFADTRPPRLAQLQVLDSQWLRLRFSEPIQADSLIQPAAYRIEGGSSPAPQITLILPNADNSAAELRLGAPLAPSVLYTLSIPALTDCAGNPAPAQADFGLPQPARPGDVVLNEILFNPYTGGLDFVELYNASDRILDLAALDIAAYDPKTGSETKRVPIAPAQTLLLPRQHLALSEDTAYQRATYLDILPAQPGAHLLHINDLPTYDDAEGICALWAADTLLDRFHYLDDYHFPALADKNGVSLERISPAAATQYPGNWHSAASTAGYATPGYRNSQAAESSPGAPGTVTLPHSTFTPDGDGDKDALFIEVGPATPGANLRINAYDAQGRPVRKVLLNTLLPSTPTTFTWDGTDDQGQRCPLGLYVLIAEVAYPDGRRDVHRLAAVVGVRF